MSEFNSFKKGLNDQFRRMAADHKNLYVTGVEKDAIWDMYLNSFPEGTNPIFKERREYDCNSCKQFIRPYGNVVAIKDNQLSGLGFSSTQRNSIIAKVDGAFKRTLKINF